MSVRSILPSVESVLHVPKCLKIVDSVRVGGAMLFRECLAVESRKAHIVVLNWERCQVHAADASHSSDKCQSARNDSDNQVQGNQSIAPAACHLSAE